MAATIGLAAFGFTVFMGSILSMLMASGDAMSHEAIEAAISQRRGVGEPSVWRASAHRVFGAAAGQQASSEASFAGIKDAWRTGEWRRDTQWLRLFVTFAGGMLLVFGIFVAIGPMPIKLICGSAIAYAVVRTAWGLARVSD